jgi:ABC-type transport system substrate-binding protein
MLQDNLSVNDFATQLANYKTAGLRVHDTLPLLPLAQGYSFMIVRKDVAGLGISPLSMDSYIKAFYATSFIYLPTIAR